VVLTGRKRVPGRGCPVVRRSRLSWPASRPVPGAGARTISRVPDSLTSSQRAPGQRWQLLAHRESVRVPGPRARGRTPSAAHRSSNRLEGATIRGGPAARARYPRRSDARKRAHRTVRQQGAARQATSRHPAPQMGRPSGGRWSVAGRCSRPRRLGKGGVIGVNNGGHGCPSGRVGGDPSSSTWVSTRHCRTPFLTTATWPRSRRETELARTSR
jgi:hypothetical protein